MKPASEAASTARTSAPAGSRRVARTGVISAVSVCATMDNDVIDARIDHVDAAIAQQGGQPAEHDEGEGGLQSHEGR